MAFPYSGGTIYWRTYQAKQGDEGLGYALALHRELEPFHKYITIITSSSVRTLALLVTHTLWECPSPPTQVSIGYSIGAPLYEFKEGQAWSSKLVDGMEELQLGRKKEQLGVPLEGFDSDDNSAAEGISESRSKPTNDPEPAPKAKLLKILTAQQIIHRSDS